jgi:hypothetical protein
LQYGPKPGELRPVTSVWLCIKNRE